MNRLALTLVCALTASAGAAVQTADAANLNASTAAELAAALTTAATNNEPDTLTLAAGTYAGNFVYNDAEELDIVGAGIGQTTLEGGATNTLSMSGNAASSVGSLSVHQLTGGGGQAGIQMAAGTVENVSVLADATMTGSGIRATSGATVRDATVDGSELGRGIEASSGVVTVERVLVKNASTAIDTNSGTADVTVRRLRAENAFRGVGAAFGAHADVSDSLILLENVSGAIGLLAHDHNNNADNDSAIDARRVTVVGTNISNQAGASVTVQSAGDVMAVDVIDSVFFNTGRGWSCGASNGGQGTVTLTRVNWAGTPSNTCGAGAITDTDRIMGEPGFVDAAGGDYRPAANSVLVDAGDPAAVPPGETDLIGTARPNDGNGDCVKRRDVGAFEYKRTAPVVAIAGPATIAAGQQANFSATGSCATEPDDVMTIAWDFGDGTNGSGETVGHTYAGAGQRVVTLTISDEDGHAASTTLNVDVTPDPNAQQGGSQSGGNSTTGTGTPGATGEAAPSVSSSPPPSLISSVAGPGTGGQTQTDAQIALAAERAAAAARDRLAPRITKLRYRKGRLTFRLSERARVSVKIGKRTIRVRGKAGANRIKVRRSKRFSLTAVDPAGNTAKKRLRLA